MIKIKFRDDDNSNTRIIDYESFHNAHDMNEKEYDKEVAEVLQKMKDAIISGRKVKFEKNATGGKVLLPEYDVVFDKIFGIEEKFTTLEQLASYEEELNKIRDIKNKRK